MVRWRAWAHSFASGSFDNSPDDRASHARLTTGCAAPLLAQALSSTRAAGPPARALWAPGRWTAPKGSKGLGGHGFEPPQRGPGVLTPAGPRPGRSGRHDRPAEGAQLRRRRDPGMGSGTA